MLVVASTIVVLGGTEIYKFLGPHGVLLIIAVITAFCITIRAITTLDT